MVVDKRPMVSVGRARLDHLSGRSLFGDGVEHAVGSAERSGDGVVSDDEERPALADDLERPGEGAVLAFAVLAEHRPSLPVMGSITGPVVLP